MAKEFDYNKDKKFEEDTNFLHYENLHNYISNNDELMVWLRQINDLESQKRGIDVRAQVSDGSRHNIELKTDRHTESPNLFLEDISNYENKQLGWTMKCEADMLSYGFYDKKCDCLKRQYIIDMPKLKEWFRENYRNYDPKTIKNIGYRARGRAVPIEDIKEFMLWDSTQQPKKTPIKEQKLSDFF